MVVDWPFASGQGGKARPALIVQNDRDNQRLRNTILAMITSVTRRALEPTQLFIDIRSTDGHASGLRQDSVVNCINLFTVEKSKILQTIGHLSPALMQPIDRCLKVALELP